MGWPEAQSFAGRLSVFRLGKGEEGRVGETGDHTPGETMWISARTGCSRTATLEEVWVGTRGRSLKQGGGKGQLHHGGRGAAAALILATQADGVRE